MNISHFNFPKKTNVPSPYPKPKPRQSDASNRPRWASIFFCCCSPARQLKMMIHLWLYLGEAWTHFFRIIMLDFIVMRLNTNCWLRQDSQSFLFSPVANSRSWWSLVTFAICRVFSFSALFLEFFFDSINLFNFSFFYFFKYFWIFWNTKQLIYFRWFIGLFKSKNTKFIYFIKMLLKKSIDVQNY